jgi:hypothetical protein
MPERVVEIKDFCTAWCYRRASEGFMPKVVPLICRMDHGGLVFGVYSLNYNGHRAASILLRKAKAFVSQRDLSEALANGLPGGDLIESERVVADHVASWEALDTIPQPLINLLAAIQKEAQGFTREASGTRNLKFRIEQDIRNFNVLLYGNRLAVPMIFELGDAGMVFGFYNDDEANVENRGNLGSLVLDQAMSFNDVGEMRVAFDHGYDSGRQVRFALDHVTRYCTLLDMHVFAENEHAKEMISLIPLKPDKIELLTEEVGDGWQGDEPRAEYLKLWGIELPVRKELVPDALKQDVSTVAEISDGISKVLKADVGKTAKTLLTKEIKNPFRSKKPKPAE